MPPWRRSESSHDPYQPDPDASPFRQQAQTIAGEIVTPRYAAPQLQPRQAQCSYLFRFSTAVLVCALTTLLYAGWQRTDKRLVMRWLAWMQQHQIEGRIVFVAVYSATLVAMIPGSALAVLAGARCRCCLLTQLLRTAECSHASQSRKTCTLQSGLGCTWLPLCRR